MALILFRSPFPNGNREWVARLLVGCGATILFPAPLPAANVADCYSTWWSLGVANVDYLEMLTGPGQFLSGDSSLARGEVYFAVQMLSHLCRPGDSFCQHRLRHARSSGQAGPDYEVQVSSNLVNWSALWSTNSPPMPFQFADTNSTSRPAQFYRIQAGPPLP